MATLRELGDEPADWEARLGAPTLTVDREFTKDIEGTIAIDNVSLWCGSCSAARRSKKVVDDAGNKQRACIKCDTTFPNPGM